MKTITRNADPSSTTTWIHLTKEWNELVATSSWMRHLKGELIRNDIRCTGRGLVDTINSLDGPDRYLPVASRDLLGQVVCRAPDSDLLMRAAMQAALFSFTRRWMERKVNYGSDVDVRVSSYISFAFIELSKRQCRAKQRDPLACIRLNATNRAASSIKTFTKAPCAVDRPDSVSIDSQLDVVLEAVADQESFDFMTESWASVSGLGATDAALTVLHDSFGLSFDDLANVSGFSRATVHRRVSAARDRFRQGLTAVA